MTDLRLRRWSQLRSTARRSPRCGGESLRASTRPATGRAALAGRSRVQGARTSDAARDRRAPARSPPGRQTHRREPRRRAAPDRRCSMRERQDEIAAARAPRRPASRPRTRAARPTRGDRDGHLRGRRGAPLLRPDDHERGAQQAGDDRPPAARRGRPDHRRQHADRQRRVEGVPRAALRQRRRAQGRRGHAADRAGRSRGWPREAGLPAGVLNVVHGLGEEAGAPLVEHPRRRDVVSFTGSHRGRPRDRARPPASGWPRSASSSAARTR